MKGNETMKRNLMKLFLALLIVIIIASLRLVSVRYDAKELQQTHISKSEVAAELSFFVYSKAEWQEFFRAYKEEYITREMVYDILRRVGVIDVVSFDEVGKQQAVARTEWNDIYEQLLDYLDITETVQKKEVLILSCEERDKERVLYTNIGTIVTELPSTYFQEWESYTLYLIENQCMGIDWTIEKPVTLLNAYISQVEENQIHILYDKRSYEKTVELHGTEIKDGVADITFLKGEVTVIGQKQDYIEGHLLSYDDTTIEIEGYGRIVHQGKLPVYRAYDMVEELHISDIILGNMDVKYVIGDNVVCAILITAPAEIEQVRVLLLASDGGKFRENVYITCDQTFSICSGEENVAFPGESVICAKDYITSQEDTLILKSEWDDAMFYLCDANGANRSNGYAGSMEVRRYQEGYCVVNQVDFETYLYSVVPSEMPSNYQPEALKAQAVCARSYAYIQVVRADLAAYGAHINDSSSYQVYNNIMKTEASKRAVDETAGKVMLYEGDVVEAYYFSTSMGYTDTAEVWNPAKGVVCGYLKPACLNHVKYEGDMSKEEGFKAYLESDVTGYDSDIRFYRWKINADYSNKTEQLKNTLTERRNAMQRHITYYKDDAVTETESMKEFGDFVSMKVAERSTSGSILVLRLQFEKGYAEVKNEYNIRKILGIGAQNMTYKDGSTGSCGSLLPSAFCTVELQEDGTYLLHGGGYGHGIGMSQNAANGLAKSGYTYLDILNYFYNEIEVVDIRS